MPQSLTDGAGSDVGAPPDSGVAVPPFGRARWVVNGALSLAVVGAAVYSAPLLLAGLAVAVLIAASLEALVPLHPGRRSWRSALVDLTHAVGNRTLLLPVFALVATSFGVLSQHLIPAGFHRGFDAQAAWVRFLAVFVTSDLFNYLGHRALHEVPALWRLHAVHHSSERMDCLSTSRGHPLDEAINVTVAAIPAFALGSATYASVVVAFLYLYPFVAHANARLDVPVLGRLVVTPRFHHWHHADAEAAVNRNYGAILSIWDDLFGTALRADGYPERYGIGKPQLAVSDYLGHLISPVSRQLWPSAEGVP